MVICPVVQLILTTVTLVLFSSKQQSLLSQFQDFSLTAPEPRLENWQQSLHQKSSQCHGKPELCYTAMLKTASKQGPSKEL